MNNNVIGKKSCAFAILARDCNINLKKNILRVEELASYFKEYKILILENNSRDGTKKTLQEWAKSDSNVVVDSKDYNFDSNETVGSGSSRIERMTLFRNKYLEYYRTCEYKYDYLIVLDIDIDYFDPKAVLDSIVNAPKDWIALLANGRFYTTFLGKIIIGKYYDNYAFVPYNSDNLELNYEEVRCNNDIVQYGLKKNDYLKCNSAFGGIGVYSYEAAMKCNYSTYNNTRSDYYNNICEHIPFNYEMNKYGNLYISKKMNVLYERKPLIKTLFTLNIKQSTMLWFYKKILIRNIPQ